MTYKIIILAILAVFLCNTGYGAENIYTWKDEQGVLNITDQAPPDGAEIIDISPSYKNNVTQSQEQRLIREERTLQGQQQQQVVKEAAQLRRVEAKARRTAEEYFQKAEAIQDTGWKAKRRTYIWKATQYRKKAKAALKEAEAAAKQAEKLEKRLGS